MNILKKFIIKHELDYETALQEIRKGRKETHWIWYIFPQLYGLGKSDISMYYAIHDIKEAKEYLDNEYLRKHMIQICEALLSLENKDIHEIMGFPDDLKLCSSMTLFSCLNELDIFDQVLEKYYDGKKCEKTLMLLQRRFYD